MVLIASFSSIANDIVFVYILASTEAQNGDSTTGTSQKANGETQDSNTNDDEHKQKGGKGSANGSVGGNNPLDNDNDDSASKGSETPVSARPGGGGGGVRGAKQNKKRGG